MVMIENKMKKGVVIVGSILLAILLTCMICIKNPGIYQGKVENTTLCLYASYTDKEVGELVKGRVADQTFLSTQDTMISISIGFVTYDRPCKGTVTVELWDEQSKQMVKSWTRDTHRLSGYYHTGFTFDNPLKKTKNKMFRVKVYSKDAVYGQGVSVFVRHKDSYKDGAFYLNGKKHLGNMMLNVNYQLDKPIKWHDKKPVINLLFLIWCYILFIGAVLFIAWKVVKKICKKRKAFVAFFTSKKTLLVLMLGLIGATGVSFLLNYIVNQKLKYNLMYFIWCLFFCYLMFFLRCLLTRKGTKPEYIFLALSIGVGLLLTITLPIQTSVAFDDETHYSNVVSTSYLSNVEITNADHYMIDRIYLDAFDLHNIRKQWKEMNGLFYGKNNVRSTYTMNYWNVPYVKLAYIPAAVTYQFGRFLHLPFVFVFMLGRMANLFTYSVIIFYGIKRMKWGKYILMSIALFPICMFQASNYTYDYWLNAWMFYGSASIFGMMQQKEKITNTQIATMLLGFLVGLAPKAVYVVLMLLAFLVPKQQFKEKRQRVCYYVSVIAVMGIVTSVFLLPFFSAGPGVGDLRGGTDVNAEMQVAYILGHPWTYTKVLLSFFKTRFWNVPNLIWSTNQMGFIGNGFFGGVCFLFVILSVCYDYSAEGSMNGIKRLCSWLCVFGLSSVVATVMYISYTGVGKSEILGCQERYIIPMLFPTVYAFGTFRISGFARKYISYKKWETYFAYGNGLLLFLNCLFVYIIQYH